MKQKTSLHNWFLTFDRTFSEKIWWQIIILLGFVFLALLVGLVICAFLPFGKEGEKLPFYEWAVYLFIDSNALNGIYTDEYTGNGRIWVILFSLLGSLLGVVVFGGMLISVLSNMLERRIENYRKGKNTYVISGHHVILGYDEIVPSIIKQICSDKDAYVLLQSSLPSEEIAEMIHSSIAQDCEKRVIIKNGHRTSVQDLAELRLNEACDIFIVGDRTQPSHDAMNIDCMEKVYGILSENNSKGLPESITTVFEDQDTYAALQVTDLFENLRNLGIEFVPYNFYTDWAKQMFVDTDGTKFPFIDGNGISSNCNKHVHIVIVGTSSFGATLGIEAAKMLHFPNCDGIDNRTEITFIDLNADQELQLFMTRVRHFFEVQEHKYGVFVKDENGKLNYIEETRPATLFNGNNANFLDIDFRFIKGDIYTKEVQDLITLWACDDKQILSLIFAMRDSRHNMSIAMNLPDKVYERGTRVFVRQNSSSKFLDKVRELSDKPKEKKIINDKEAIENQQIKGRYANIYPFGMTDIMFDVNKRTQQIAECINYIYDVYYDGNYIIDENGKPITKDEKGKPIREGLTLPKQLLRNGDKVLMGMMEFNKENVLNTAHKKWITHKVSDQWSNLYSAYNIGFRERTLKAEGYTDCMHLSPETLLKMAEVEHNRWNVEKLLMGFRKPISEEDAYQLDLSKYEENKKKDVFDSFKKANNKNHYIHADIRPFSQLNEIQEVDKEIIRFIPWFLKMSND